MKLFKKLAALALIAVSALSLTACDKQSLNADGRYWFSDPTGFTLNFKETLEYSVNVSQNTPFDSTVVKNENVSISVTSGSYVTTLETVGALDLYKYTTTLAVSGEYVTPTGSVPFNDLMETECVFNKNYEPVSSYKKCTNSSILTVDEIGSYVLVNYSFKYQTEYDLNKNVATSTFIEYDPKSVAGTDESNWSVANTTTYTYDNFTSGAFVDNEALLLLPRIYNVDKDLVVNFKTIDVLSQKNHEMIYYAVNDGETVDVKSFAGYTLNGITSNDLVECNHLSIYIDDTFEGYPLEVYYAKDASTHRHRLLRAYSKLNDSLGYLEYTLINATVTQ